MFAIVRTGAKQYKVQKGDVIRVEKLDVEAGKSAELDNVLYIGGEKTAKVGDPLVKGAKVVAEVISQEKDKKIKIFKKKRRQNYRRSNGHRQQITVLRIKDIKAA